MQLIVFVSVYLMAALPLWLTPIAHLAEFIRRGFRSTRARTQSVGQQTPQRLTMVPVRN